MTSAAASNSAPRPASEVQRRPGPLHRRAVCRANTAQAAKNPVVMAVPADISKTALAPAQKHALREREDKNQNGAGTRTQPGGDDRAERAGPREIALQRRRVDSVEMTATRRMHMRGIVHGLAIKAAAARDDCRRRPKRGEKSAAFFPNEAGSEQRDGAVTREFDRIRRVFHLHRRGAQQRRRRSDQGYRDAALEQGGQRREDHAAPQRGFAGDHIGGQHGLAVARTRGVKHAVGEARPRQRPEGGAAGFEGFGGGLQFDVKFVLPGENRFPPSLSRRPRPRLRPWRKDCGLSGRSPRGPRNRTPRAPAAARRQSVLSSSSRAGHDDAGRELYPEIRAGRKILEKRLA